jgi:transposase-like protein
LPVTVGGFSVNFCRNPLCWKHHQDACQKAGCSNNNISLKLAPSAYRAFGVTAKGDPRHQCKGCGSTFSLGSATRRHKRTDQTGSILLNLVNKVPLSRICEINGVTFPQIYSKIDFIYRQCLAMSAAREGDLARCLAGKDQFFGKRFLARTFPILT